jgi:hypothetical protein
MQKSYVNCIRKSFLGVRDKSPGVTGRHLIVEDRQGSRGHPLKGTCQEKRPRRSKKRSFLQSDILPSSRFHLTPSPHPLFLFPWFAAIPMIRTSHPSGFRSSWTLVFSIDPENRRFHTMSNGLGHSFDGFKPTLPWLMAWADQAVREIVLTISLTRREKLANQALWF